MACVIRFYTFLYSVARRKRSVAICAISRVSGRTSCAARLSAFLITDMIETRQSANDPIAEVHAGAVLRGEKNPAHLSMSGA